MTVDDRPVKAFVSYSRVDRAVAEHTRQQLVDAGFEAYLDLQDILPTEPWRERLGALIAAADAVIFLITPDSCASAVCDWEVNEAERLEKRIVPVVIRDTAEEKVPGRLRRLNYIFMRSPEEEPAGYRKLFAALLVDIEWVREHTRTWSARRRLEAQ